MLEWHVLSIHHGFNDKKSIFFLNLMHCLHISGYLCHSLYNSIKCSDNQLAHSGKCKLKCIRLTDHFSKILMLAEAIT